MSAEVANHPRPQLRRPWTSLDGRWSFAWDRDAGWRSPSEVRFDAEIEVPFAPETAAGGLGAVEPWRACWYRRSFEAPALGDGERLLLHFGAVDHDATVWVNGALVAHHEGGWTPFSADVTEAVAGAASHEIVVRAVDDPLDMELPRGKQDWREQPHMIWYPRTTGIWQRVWLEVVPAVRIETLHWRPSVADWALGVEVRLDGWERDDDLQLSVTLRAGDRLLARDRYGVIDGEVTRTIALPDAGIFSERDELLWSPRSPTLIDAELELLRGGEVVDRVASYSALRSVAVDRGRFLLNDQPLPLRLVLDQGTWPDSGLTPPSLEAIERDVELTQALGFNGVRKHQKIEDPRFLRVADERGLLVWEELPSAYRFSNRAAGLLTRTWTEAIERDRSHPCIVAWLPVNESWGVPSLPASPRQRALVTALCALARTLDGDRPTLGNDGWELSADGDLLGIHDYGEADLLASRYADGLDRVLEQETLSRRRLLLDGVTRAGRPVVLSEFGGIAFTPADEEAATWGYDRVRDAGAFVARYAGLLEQVHAIEGLAGFCYTQLTDTHQEANGLLTAEREPKGPLAALAAATRGDRVAREVNAAATRREGAVPPSPHGGA
ncbi:sugar-binding domain-containing protein [Conexibacter stalactiti]|uniref:Glycoside hydrolase family 2 TIM barrel-domain containing protein n=1 Tax=Conexibacter stalactiti TaxID=1940611 RepID=A0ABU4HTI2_9ACTN|nr:sugar-binding domain-containing protein [Conexibacter stalactiti]MDW5596618.1 glycoside hydrolase family 2 TIM barrel-domain containing protein [Conexibacter stalactiti]MEC5037260.1 sugar-binding domain-containing protein [Conexibacter stalactiti]